MSAKKPITLGAKLFRWTVLGRANSTTRGKLAYFCRCECGTEKVIAAHYLRSGESKSCGCLKTEIVAARVKTHGMTGSRMYQSWANMVARCQSDHPRYGGRGIKVCERWLKFENFLADMGGCPPGMSIDRIDNDGNYEPSNCRWASRKQQQRNTSHNALYSFHGKTMTLVEWADHVKIKYHTLYTRLSSGWSVDRAFTTPARKGNYFGTFSRSRPTSGGTE